MASHTTTLLITAVVVVGALLPATASAEDDDYYIVVGDQAGWALGVDYNDWASGQTFNVGDMLKFEYSTGQPFPHNVVVVNQASFDACTVPMPTNAFTLTSGDDKVLLWYAGQYFFISGINSDCKSGMKLAINVAQ